jgi:hypothetical protein
VSTSFSVGNERTDSVDIDKRSAYSPGVDSRGRVGVSGAVRATADYLGAGGD